jgi:hypothetical protein
METPVSSSETSDQPDDAVPFTDEMEKLGFSYGDGYMYMYPMGPQGLEIVIPYETNTRSDNHGYATSMSLHWSYTLPTGKISPMFHIRDHPTIGQIKAMVEALKGE